MVRQHGIMIALPSDALPRESWWLDRERFYQREKAELFRMRRSKEGQLPVSDLHASGKPANIPKVGW